MSTSYAHLPLGASMAVAGQLYFIYVFQVFYLSIIFIYINIFKGNLIKLYHDILYFCLICMDSQAITGSFQVLNYPLKSKLI
jgi:hypothetical protein